MSEEPDSPEVPSAPSAATPFGAWRAPVLWMACGALLAGVVGAAVLLAQRIGVERDMAAVALLVPPPPPAESTAAPIAVAPPVAAPQPGVGAEASPGASPGSLLQAATRLENDRKASRPAAQRTVKAAKATKATKARKTATVGKATKPAKPRAYRRKAATEKSLYWNVFKRCPLPGEPGAVECRRHICNGAERGGPACKAYRGKWR